MLIQTNSEELLDCSIALTKPKLAYLLKQYYNTIVEFRYNEHVPVTETRLADLDGDITMTMVELLWISPSLLFLSPFFFFFF